MNKEIKKTRHYWFSTAAFLILGLSLTGCANWISESGPRKSAITNQNAEDRYYNLVEITPDSIANYMVREPLDPKKDVAPLTQKDARLSSGDVLNILIADNDPNGGIFAPLNSVAGGTSFKDVRVASNGKISIPYIDGLQVRGLTLAQVQVKIRNYLKQYAIDPHVYVSFQNELDTSVLVAGDVNKPGRFSTLQGPLTLIDVINMAGGPTKAPYLIEVTVRNGKDVKKYNYQEILDGHNYKLSPNSEVILSDAFNKFIAMGAVKTPGYHDFPTSSPTLLQALGSIGGLNDNLANVSGVFVFRMPAELQRSAEEKNKKVNVDAILKEVESSKEKPTVFLFDMRNPTMMFLANEFPIHANDTIYVTNSPVSDFDKFIAPIFRVLLLGRYLGID